jgi:hypothetical protein
VSSYGNDINLAKTVLTVWINNKYPVFRRLVLHSYTATNITSSDEALHYLLEDDGWWLWSVVTQRERYRLLSKIWPELSVESTNKLIEVILQGPLREMYRNNLTADEWDERCDRDIWHILMKLNSFGRQIPDNAQKVLSDIQRRHSDWLLAEGDRDEFSHWSETRVGNDTDVSADELFGLPVPDLVRKMLEDDREFADGRIDVFRSGVKEHQDKVIDILAYISSNNIKAYRIWHAALVGLGDSDKKFWSVIAHMLSNVPNDLYSEEAWAIAWWTRKAAKDLAPYSAEEKMFWVIANRLLEMAEAKKLEDTSDIITTAINNPVGIITEALIERFSQCKLEAGFGIPTEDHLSILNKLLTENGYKYLLGRVILASRLQYFFVIDPGWTMKALLPRFDWQKSHEAKYLWQGYLWMPRVTADLSLELKVYLQQALENSKEIEKHVDRLYQIFVVICIEYPDLYSAEEQRHIMASIGIQGLIDISELLWRSVTGEQENSDDYWLNRIKPFIMRAWPRVAALVDQKISANFALMSIHLDESFSDALTVIKPYLVPVDDLSFLLHKLNNSQLLTEQPATVFELLSMIFSKNYKWPDKSLRQILNIILEASPKIREYPMYREIDEFLIQKDL